MINKIVILFKIARKIGSSDIINIIDILFANEIGFSVINTSEGDLEDVFIKVIKD